MSDDKKIVYDDIIGSDEFSAEKVLERMKYDREKLVGNWGEEAYEDRRRSLEEHIRNRKTGKAASEPSATS